MMADTAVIESPSTSIDIINIFRLICAGVCFFLDFRDLGLRVAGLRRGEDGSLTISGSSGLVFFRLGLAWGLLTSVLWGLAGLFIGGLLSEDRIGPDSIKKFRTG